MCLWLVKNGVPYDVAFNFDYSDLLAHWIVLGEFENGKWNWDTMSWDKP
jgi:hypothetical protein